MGAGEISNINLVKDLAEVINFRNLRFATCVSHSAKFGLNSYLSKKE